MASFEAAQHYGSAQLCGTYTYIRLFRPIPRKTKNSQCSERNVYTNVMFCGPVNSDSKLLVIWASNKLRRKLCASCNVPYLHLQVATHNYKCCLNNYEAVMQFSGSPENTNPTNTSTWIELHKSLRYAQCYKCLHLTEVHLEVWVTSQGEYLFQNERVQPPTHPIKTLATRLKFLVCLLSYRKTNCEMFCYWRLAGTWRSTISALFTFGRYSRWFLKVIITEIKGAHVCAPTEPTERLHPDIKCIGRLCFWPL